MEEVINGILIREVEAKNIMTKSSLPVGGYSVNPYVGCTHACKYCYASFMKRFTGHKEEWGTFLDVKHWPEIKNPKKYAGQRVVIGSVTDGYNPQEEQFRNTRKLLEQLRPRRPVDAAIHAASTQQRFLCRVDDGIHAHFRDIIANNDKWHIMYRLHSNDFSEYYSRIHSVLQWTLGRLIVLIENSNCWQTGSGAKMATL